MADELISQYVDRAAVKSDTDFLEAELNRILALYTKIKNSKVTLKASIPTKQIVDEVKEVETATTSLALSSSKLSNTLSYVREQQRLLAAQTKMTGTVVNEFDKTVAAAANEATAWGNANKAAGEKIKETTKSTLELNKAAELKRQLDKQADA